MKRFNLLTAGLALGLGWAGSPMARSAATASISTAIRPARWSTQLVLGYRGDEGLAHRDPTTRAVRARLAATSPEWKAFADNKQKLRTEKQPVVADLIAASAP
ncbi:hypothetical protein [Phenylobacterium sp.]|uniref:hypothetical protein n=1 Tax=Phenylobacterium sp. TaxID=1871053 RepID=UPI002F3F36F4